MCLALENDVNDGSERGIIGGFSGIRGRWFSRGWRINMIINDWCHGDIPDEVGRGRWTWRLAIGK